MHGSVICLIEDIRRTIADIDARCEALNNALAQAAQEGATNDQKALVKTVSDTTMPVQHTSSLTDDLPEF